MIVYYFFAIVLLPLGIKSLKGGFEFRRYFESEVKRSPSDFAPYSSIIAPFCGNEARLGDNIAALFNQKYPIYEIIFVLESNSDSALPFIENEIVKHAHLQVTSKIVFAGKSLDSGQKVHNLREAVLHVSEKSEVFAFVDSDARASEDWLRNLVEPLVSEKIGVSTGYRWFVPLNGGIWTHLRSVWNASIASQLGPRTESNFCWGGSMAIRRETFDSLNVRNRWRGTLSDDFVLTKLCKEAQLQIFFAAKCLTKSVGDCNFRELLEFTTRQMKITRVYSPKLWKASLIASGFSSIVFWLGFAVLFFATGFWFWLLVFIQVLIVFLGVYKASVRFDAIALVLTDDKDQLNASYIWQLVLWIFSPLLFFYNSLAAAFSRTILWRGIRYDIISPSETSIID